MKTCTNCGAESYRVESRFCLKCGAELPGHEDTPRQNICTNPDCQWHKSKFIYPDGARFCDVCGSKTVYAQ
jgi:ribosomal protein L40E